MTMTKRDVLELWFAEVWDARDISFLDKLLAPSLGQEDTVYGSLALRKDIPLLVEVFHRLIGPMKSEILVFLEDGDWACVNYRTTASGPDGDTPIKLDSLLMFRFDQGLIAEMISRIDSLALFEQLGQMPPDTLLGCFSGQSLTWK
ncbi:nuclear transport factor 2 family protein [Pseudophaeobacter sp. EL27]|uniref:nuclear transport factor 2 family protein n=1 Tax=Pseudophaeobacter sp. EL27 TaxID=2107580 RepID=UPI0020B1058C|nr:nuclear transport factor 2 family protein [Pseudophaeobacter sp. EL27]